jgi:hypothetical protein
MPTYNVREEVLNVVLAEHLEHRGLVSIPETIRRSVNKSKDKQLPDITIFDLLGIRMVIEGRFNSGKHPVSPSNCGTPRSPNGNPTICRIPHSLKNFRSRSIAFSPLGCAKYTRTSGRNRRIFPQSRRSSPALRVPIG